MCKYGTLVTKGIKLPYPVLNYRNIGGGGAWVDFRFWRKRETLEIINIGDIIFIENNSKFRLDLLTTVYF